MMDNKCKPANNKYLDHVYCHTTSENKNYIRANNNSNTSQDLMALIKENKQLKAMLILHLDLIQEQSDQLLAKDKLLTTLREDNDALKSKNEKLEHLIQAQQKLQRQNALKRSAGGINMGTLLSIPPPPLAKIQCISEDNPSSNGIKIDDIKVENIEKNASTTLSSPGDTGSTKLPTKQNYKIQEPSTCTEDQFNDEEKGTSIIGECNGKFISKIILHRINVSGMSPSTASESHSENEANLGTNNFEEYEEDERASVDDITNELKIRKLAVCKPARTSINIEKQTKLDSDESMSCDSISERDQKTPTNISVNHQKSHHNLPHSQFMQQVQPSSQKTKRCGYITTSEMYCTREWEDEDFCDEFIKEEAKALKSDAPMLEIPKWTIHDFAASYVIEGTEDLSDDTFLKRHAKLEYDEKRRKKWDVQQIREQRRIEKLKRRHCKDEVRETSNAMLSFYPQCDSIQTICYASDLPVLAFGEGVPRLAVNSDFILPWHQSSDNSGSSMNNSQAQLKSSFVFMKKRRRQQSSSTTQGRLRIPSVRTPSQHSILGQPSTVLTNSSGEIPKN